MPWSEIYIGKEAQVTTPTRWAFLQNCGLSENPYPGHNCWVWTIDGVTSRLMSLSPLHFDICIFMIQSSPGCRYQFVPGLPRHPVCRSFSVLPLYLETYGREWMETQAHDILILKDSFKHFPACSISIFRMCTNQRNEFDRPP